MKTFLIVHQKAVFAIILTCVTLGTILTVFDDFGIAWDEPGLYEYAQMSGAAYDVEEWRAPGFTLNSTYGKEDWRYYGPAYLLMGSMIQRAGTQLLEWGFYDSWHFANGISFIVATLLLYVLCLRYFSAGASFFAALIFFLQPLLLGHAFINPKDIPFLTFFTLMILVGFRATDSLVIDESRKPSLIIEEGLTWLGNHKRLLTMTFIADMILFFQYGCCATSSQPGLENG